MSEDMVRRASLQEWASAREHVGERGVDVQVGVVLAASGAGGWPGLPGLFVTVATTPLWPGPVGWVWYRLTTGFDARAVDVVYSWVHPGLRRCGVRTAMHEAMRDDYPEYEFATSGASSEAAVAWLETMGYEETPGGWWLGPAGGG